MCPDENDSFMTGAKEYIKDLEKKRYPVLIAGKVLQVELSLCLNRTLLTYLLPPNNAK